MNPPPKSSAKVYRKAAELIDYHLYHYCCIALHDKVYIKYLAYLFKPKRQLVGDPWWGYNSTEKEREARILALLLAAYIVEQGGLDYEPPTPKKKPQPKRKMVYQSPVLRRYPFQGRRLVTIETEGKDAILYINFTSGLYGVCIPKQELEKMAHKILLDTGKWPPSWFR